ncbi:MAG: transglutaminase domain-containing protein [archaeon]
MNYKINKIVVVLTLILVILISGCVQPEQPINPPNNNPGLPPIEPSEDPLDAYLVQVDRDCSREGVYFSQDQLMASLTGEDYWWVLELKESEAKSLESKPCVLRVLDHVEAKTFISGLKDEVKAFALQKIQESGLIKTLKERDLLSKDELDDWLKENNPDFEPDPEGGQISRYQTFVTPEAQAIVSLASKFNDFSSAYQYSARSWVWVSEQTLNNQSEKWLTPQEFLTQTPSMPSNPVKPSVASDCSEQANTLVSLYRAMGVSAVDVRVVLGEVNFDGEVGGHAWAQLKVDGEWLNLDPTSGPSWSDIEQKLNKSAGFFFTHFRFADYPVTEVWAYYNDQYVKDFHSKKDNAPEGW